MNSLLDDLIKEVDDVMGDEFPKHNHTPTNPGSKKHQAADNNNHNDDNSFDNSFDGFDDD